MTTESPYRKASLTREAYNALRKAARDADVYLSDKVLSALEAEQRIARSADVTGVDWDALTAAVKVVADGRAYTREHFPGGLPGKYVGHTPADEYDAAVDVMVDGLARLLGVLLNPDTEEPK